MIHRVKNGRLALALLAPLFLSACWELDNAFDQQLCEPSCATGMVCYNGNCTADPSLDGGPKTDSTLVDGASTDTGPFCGDNIKNGTEECDGDDLANATCVSTGHTGGTLKCTACSYDTQLCIKVVVPNGKTLVTNAADVKAMAVASDGTNYLLVWSTRPSSGTGTLYATVVDSQGDPGTTHTLATGNISDRVAVAHDGTNYFVVWSDSAVGVRGLRVNDQGAVDAKQVAIDEGVQKGFRPAVAFDGSQYFVVWKDTRHSPQYSIYGARVSKNGAVLDSAGIQIAAPSAATSGGHPSVAAGGGRFWVTWNDNRGGGDATYAARISANGELEDSEGLPFYTASYSDLAPTAFDGNNFATLWRNTGAAGNRIIRSDQSGQVLDAPGISLPPGSQRFASDLLFGKKNYLVPLQDWDAGIPGQYDLYLTKVTPAGEVDSAPTLVCNESGLREGATLGIAANNALMAWIDTRAGTYQIYGTLITL